MNKTDGRAVFAANPAPGVVLLFTEICGVNINVATIKAVDLSGYVPEDNDRKIIVKLTEGDEYIFEGPDADVANYWFLAFSGRAKVEPA